MIKTLSLVASECQKVKYLIPELPRPPEDIKDSYEGAEVLEPTPAIFLDNPVSVLDYGSLYPSSMIGSNISHDTIIVEPQYQGESGAILLENMGIKFQDISYDNYYQVLKGKTWVKKVDTKKPVVNCRYIQPPIDPKTGKIDDTKRGILPRILMKLLSARKATRAQIKKEKDPFRISVLDGLQLAYKVTANSLYGGVGAAVSSLYYKDIAASTTAVGRRHLHLAKDYVQEHYPNAEIVYGDTDSIFVNFNVHKGLDEKLSNSEALQKSIDLSVEVENGIQSLLDYPHKLEYEKTFYPFLLLRKKGYVGNKYEFDLNKYKQNSMGVVTKRRDNAPIVKYVYDGIIKRIMNDRDIQSAIQFLLDCFKRILQGDFSIQYFIVTKQLKSQYAFPDRVVHKVLADRIGDRDPGNKPQSNDRIPYVYVNTKTIPKLQGDRVEHPDYIKEHNLRIDYLFYITNQIQKPVCQVFALALEELRVHGYNVPVNHFDRMKTQLQNGEKKLEPSKIREKIMDKKMDEVYKVLFKKRVQIEEGKRYGQKHISDFFSKR
jgi:DNA polymerase elongation subunit (family B)